MLSNSGVCVQVLLLLLLLLLTYSCLLLIRWRSSSKSVSHQEIKAIYPSTLRITCAVLLNAYYYNHHHHYHPCFLEVISCGTSRFLETKQAFHNENGFPMFLMVLLVQINHKHQESTV